MPVELRILALGTLVFAVSLVGLAMVLKALLAG
jgi:hypothetical protein